MKKFFKGDLIMKLNHNQSALQLSDYSLNDIFHALSKFAVEYPKSLKANLTDLFFENYSKNPVICFAVLADSLTRKALINEEFFRDNKINFSLVSINDKLKSNISCKPVYSSFPVDYPVPQWKYTDNKDINQIIFMLNILIEIVQFNLKAAIRDYIKEAVIEANNIEGKIIERENKFMILTVVDESPFHFHASVSNADGSNLYDDYMPYLGFPVLNGIKAFNFGNKPVKILYMPAI